MSGNIETYTMMAKKMNEIIQYLVNNEKINSLAWSFDEACHHICNHAYGVLKQLGKGKDFEVVYVRRVEGKDVKLIYASAFCNKDLKPPSICGRKRDFESDPYYDSKLFRSGKSDMEVVCGSEKIVKIFNYKGRNTRKRRNKYTQFIAIPVFCESKMIGLFEIASLNQTKIGDSQSEVEEIASRYMNHYSALILLLYKLKKMLHARACIERE